MATQPFGGAFVEHDGHAADERCEQETDEHNFHEHAASAGNGRSGLGRLVGLALLARGDALGCLGLLVGRENCCCATAC